MMQTESSSTPIYAWFILAVALFAVSSAGAVFELVEGIGGLTKAAWRLQATTVVLLPFFLYQFMNVEEEVKQRWQSSLPLLLASGICLTLHFGTWLMSLDRTTLTHSLLFVTAHPLVIIFGMWLLRQPATRQQSGGAMLGFAGAAVVAFAGGNEPGVDAFGDLLAFAGAVTIVGYLAIGRQVRGWMPLFLYAFPVTFVAAILLTVWAGFSEGVVIGFSSSDIFGWTSAAWIAYFSYLALGPGLAGHTGINAVLRWISPLIISLVLVMEPVIGSLIGWAVGVDSIPGIWTLSGGVLMISGLLLVTLESDSSEQID